MTERERLVELLRKDNCCIDYDCNKCLSNTHCYPKTVADCILADGWIRPPCKVGDVVWLIGNMKLYTKEVCCSRKVTSIQQLRTGEWIMHFKDGCFNADCIGVHVFYSQKEAEKALRGGEQG